MRFSPLFCFSSVLVVCLGLGEVEDHTGIVNVIGSAGELFPIEGNVSMINSTSNDWLQMTRVLVDDSSFQGFLRTDGSFRLSLPPGSYVVSVVNPVFTFEALRVNVSGLGSVSAQTINHIQPNETTNVSYPLQMQPLGRIQYFQTKPTFRVIDILKSRMVLMMFLPCIIIMVALRFVDMDDPEVKEELNSLDWKQRMPDLAEHLSRIFGGKPPARPAIGQTDETGTADSEPTPESDDGDEAKAGPEEDAGGTAIEGEK